ncbi:MAG: class II fructose-bisphosphate aldolase [bacterium]|nr:class II fructose-bisphosphate aldolase [bacterium]
MNAREWLEKAKRENFAIPALNVGTFETFKGIVAAAINKKSPVIIESSTGETRWMEAENVASISRNFAKKYGLAIIVNLDHAYTYEDTRPGFEGAYDLIHFDGSKLPYEENVTVAKKVVPEAHNIGALVEGEIDKIVGEGSEQHTETITEEAIKSGYTDPQRAKKFVEETGVDIFASFFGNTHGTFPGPQPPLDIELIKKVSQTVPAFLSMHGASGVPAEQVKEAIKEGDIVKVNVNTDIRVAYREGLEKALAEHKDVAMYKVFPGVVEAVQKVAETWIDICGSEGKL